MPRYRRKPEHWKKNKPYTKSVSIEARKIVDQWHKVEVKNEDVNDVKLDLKNVKYLETPAKSEHDKNEYRVIELANGLTVLLISMPKNETRHYGACCDVCINVGTFSDPPECPGLARITALAIYNESRKRLQAKDFEKCPNITVMTSTGSEETNLRLCMVPEEYLEKALNIFSEAIINPEISFESVNLARTQTELIMSSWFETKNQLLANFAQSRHPASKYATGNRQVLHDASEKKVQELFVKFRERHYSGHRTTVMIKAQLPLDTLEKYGVECFSGLPRNGLPVENFDEFKGLDPFVSMKPQTINIRREKFHWNFEIIWILPLMDEHQIYKAHDYLSWILRYRGEGSIFSYLENKNWCNDIGCGSSDNFSCNSLYSTLNLSLLLTEEGLKNIMDVVSAVFSYITMLRERGPEKRIFEEILRVKIQRFRYMNTFWKETFSKRMQLFSPARYITGNELFLDYDEKSISFCMDLLTPERMNIVTYKETSKSSLDFDIESFFESEKFMEKIPEECIQYWRKLEPLPDFHLPKTEAFVADNFPSKIYSDSWSEIWYKYDEINFRAGEGHVNLHFISPLVMTSPENVAMLDLFATILQKKVALLIYPQCDMSCDLRPGMKGLWLNVSGFEAIVLPLMIKSVVTSISQCSNGLTENFFNSTKQEQLQLYRGNFMDPVELAEDLKQSMIVSVYRSFVDLHAALFFIEHEQFCKFMKGFIDDVRIQCYAHGRMSKQDVIGCVRNCFDILNRGIANPKAVLNHGVTEIPPGIHCSKVQSFGAVTSCSAVTNYYQFDNPSFELATMIDALSTVMQKIFQDQKYCVVRGIYGLYGYSLTGTDCKARVVDIDESIEAFREVFRKTFENMTTKELEEIKITLLLSKEQECASLEMDLESKVNANWIEIMSEKYIFDRRARELALISKITTEDIRSWMIKFGMNESDSRFRKLSIQVHGYDYMKSLAQEFWSQRIDDIKTEFPHIYKLNKYQLKYVENRWEDGSKNRLKEKVINDLNAYKRELIVIPLILSTL